MAGRGVSGKGTVLRVAAAWGTTVLATKTLARGESLAWGRRRRGFVAQPDGLNAASTPIRAVSSGWHVDPYGTTGGVLRLGGREEDPTLLSTKVAIAQGDWGVLQYGSFSLSFQLYEPAPPIAEKSRADWLLRVALGSSVAMHAAVFAAVRLLTAAPSVPRPVELVAPWQVAARFGLHAMPPATRAPSEAAHVSAGAAGWDSAERIAELKRALRAVRSFPAAAEGPSAVPGARAPISVVYRVAAASGGLSADAWSGFVAGRLTAIRVCHESEMGSGPDARGALDLGILVAADGSVKATAVQASTFQGPKLGACLVREARSWRLPASGSASDAVVSLRFVPGGDR